MNKFLGAALGLAAIFIPALASAEGPVAAQPVPALSSMPVIALQKQATGNSLPSNSEIWVSVNNEVNSKRVKMSEKFDVTVSRDVMLGDYIVIPRGTRGTGQVSYRTGKGAFGKSAKFEFDIVSLDMNGRYVPLTGHYRIEGQGNTGAAVGAAVAVGPFGAFVTGRSAIVPQGTEYRAYTKEAIAVTLAPATQPVAVIAPVAFTN